MRRRGQFVFGVVLFLLGIFLVVALLMTSVDKLLQITTQHLNFKTGYSHVVPHVINPVDKLFTLMQKVRRRVLFAPLCHGADTRAPRAAQAFPLDYIFLTMLVYYFIMCTMSGVRALDVRFCFLKMFKVGEWVFARGERVLTRPAAAPPGRSARTARRRRASSSCA